MTAVDQITKIAIRAGMNVGDTRMIWTGVLRFTFYENSGAASSSFQGYGRLFGIVAVIFIVLVFYYRMKNRPNNRVMDVGLAFLVAGAAGNGIERLLFGKVTDFLQFGSGRGILNIADVSINIGILIILIQQIFFSRRSKKKQMIS